MVGEMGDLIQRSDAKRVSREKKRRLNRERGVFYGCKKNKQKKRLRVNAVITLHRNQRKSRTVHQGIISQSTPFNAVTVYRHLVMVIQMLVLQVTDGEQ